MTHWKLPHQFLIALTLTKIVCSFSFQAVVKVKEQLCEHPWSKMAWNFTFCMCKWILHGPERADWLDVMRNK